MSTSANSASGKGKGIQTFEFPRDNGRIKVESALVMIEGLMMGERVYKWADILKASDEENKLYAYMWINPDKKKSGGWFNASEQTAQRFDYIEGVIVDREVQDYKKERNSILDNNRYISKIEGYWTEKLMIDGEEFWNIN